MILVRPTFARFFEWSVDGACLSPSCINRMHLPSVPGMSVRLHTLWRTNLTLVVRFSGHAGRLGPAVTVSPPLTPAVPDTLPLLPGLHLRLKLVEPCPIKSS